MMMMKMAKENTALLPKNTNVVKLGYWAKYLNSSLQNVLYTKINNDEER